MSINQLISEAQELTSEAVTLEQLEEIQLKLEEDSDNYADQLREGKRLEDILVRPIDDPLVRSVLSAAFDDMVKHLDNTLNSSARNGGKYKRILKALDPEIIVATVLAHSMPTLINRDSIANSVQKLTALIGRGIVTEVKIDQAYKIHPLYMKAVTDRITDRKSRNLRYLTATYDNAFNTVTLGELKYELSNSDYIHIGKIGLDAMYQAGLIELSKVRISGRTWSIYNLNPVIYEFITSENHKIHRRRICNRSRFMVCPPDDWTGITGGGFKSARRKLSNQLIAHKGDFDFKWYEANLTPNTAPLVYRMVNGIQKIPFTINEAVLSLIQDVMDEGGGILGVPPLNNPERPPFPFHEDWKQETATESELREFSYWKGQVVEWYDTIKVLTQKRRDISEMLSILSQGFNTIYFPVYLDFRGRLYYSAIPSPQGSDLSKACLELADKKPLGDRGLYWLKVHLANCLGYDKVRMDARVEFVDDNWEYFEKALENPIDMFEAWGDDSPLTAYSAALHIKRALDSGDPSSYLCGMPVHMDATVSGTQHFSAMLRDSVGGEYSNLLDKGQPQKSDMYSKVAEITLDDVKSHKTDISQFWTDYGLPRDLVKRPVMTYTYGVTKVTVNAHVWHYLKANPGSRDPETKEITGLTNSLFDAIAKTIPATVEGMDFLMEVAKHYKEDRMVWTTPTGFKVLFHPKVSSTKRIAVRSAGVDLAMYKFTEEKTNRRKFVSGISPNFVHSMDASHLCLVANGMLDRGLQLVCIHDSIGTHPCDVDDMHYVIRDAFVKMYSGNILQDLKEELGSDVELPEYGDLDINEVYNSEFFFC